MGNEKVNQRLLSRGNPPVNDKSDSDMEVYIRNKYEKRLYMTEGSYQAPSSTIFGSNSQPNLEQYSRQLQTLASMGFTNTSLCMQALQNSNGSIERAIELIVSRSEGKEPSRQKQINEPAYQIQLKQLGFSNTEANERAYKIANGNMEQTVSILIDAQTSRRTSQPPTPKISTPLVDLLDSNPSFQPYGAPSNNFQINQLFQLESQQNQQSIQQNFTGLQPNQIQFRNQMQQQQYFQQQMPIVQNNLQFNQKQTISQQQDPFQSFNYSPGNANFNPESTNQRNQFFPGATTQLNTGNNFDLSRPQIQLQNQLADPFQEQSMQFATAQQIIPNQSFNPTQMNSQEFLYQQEKVDFEAKKHSNQQKESILSMYKTTNAIPFQNQPQGIMNSNPFLSQIPHNQSSGMNPFGQINVF